MQDVLAELAAVWRAGGTAGVGTVVRTFSSAPRQPGAAMVVAPDGKVAPRPVKLGGAQGNAWMVLDGLKEGEQVMVDGFQKLRPNAVVKPVPWQAPGTKPVAAASAAKS